MLCLAEDWARALPQPPFEEAVRMALEAGTQIPPRPEREKAPRLDPAAYEEQARLLRFVMEPLQGATVAAVLPLWHLARWLLRDVSAVALRAVRRSLPLHRADAHAVTQLWRSCARVISCASVRLL